MTIKKGDFIEVEYTGKIIDDGIVFDTTDEKVAKLLDVVWMMESPLEDMPLELTYISIDKGSVTIEGVTEVSK